MTVVYNLGDLAGWLSALGGLGSVGAAIWIAKRQQDEIRRQVEVKEAEDHVYQTEIVRQGLDLIDGLISSIRGRRLTFHEAHWNEYTEIALSLSGVANRLTALSQYPVLSPVRRLELEGAAAACSLPKASIHGTASFVTHELRQLLARLERAKEGMAPLL